MCGLAGFVEVRGGLGREEAAARVRAMTAAIAHRGPDGAGDILLDEADGMLVGLGHRRLSVIDLSPAGAQPMASLCGRYVIVFNGEIYNYRTLRGEIEARRGAVAWRGHSDTEVLLELVVDLGVDAALGRLDGMFAIALYDRVEHALTLARDAFGEKPLYYGLWDGTLLFGSELKALRAWPGFAPARDPQAIADFLTYSYIPAPATIHAGIAKLPPANRLTLTAAHVRRGALPAPVPYWDMVGAALAARARGFSGDFVEAQDELEALLLRSTLGRMVADVPLGALLSGGVDSSLATAMMQKNSTNPVRTFTIGMDEPGFNEANHARAVSAHLGTAHTELLLTPAEVQAAIPTIASMYDEPFADSSQVPTFLVSRMAREQVTVAMSGDGADEIFAGYNRYFHGPRVWARMQRVPPMVRELAGAAMHAAPASALEGAARLAGRFAPRELAAGRAGEKLHKLAGLLSARTPDDFHQRLLATGNAHGLLADAGPATSLARRADARALDLDFASRSMLVDTATYLPDDVLTKVDRASMSVALEARTPYLNRELFGFAWALPTAMKVSATQGKVLLRELLYRHVPRALVDRPKAGFAIPVGRWLRGPLREWAESLLAPATLRGDGVLQPARVQALWSEHLSGRRDHDTALWSILMFQAWRLETERR